MNSNRRSRMYIPLKDVVPEPPMKSDTDIRPIPKRILRDLARALQMATGQNYRDKWFDKTIGDNRIKYAVSFPLWHLPSLGYQLAQYITDDTEFLDFNDGQEVPAGFNTLQYKRGASVETLVDGYGTYFYKDTTAIIGISIGSNAHMSIYGSADEQDIIKEFFDKIKADTTAFETLKGEKLLITSRNAFLFLDYDCVRRDDIILTQKTWDRLDDNFFFIINNKELIEKEGLAWRRGILIWGPPGTGKTMFGKLLCNETEGMTMLWVTPRCIDDDSDVSKIFDMARLLAPSIVFFEDIDFFAKSREEYGHSYVLGELLTQLDGLSPNEGVFVIGTTNKPFALDAAIGSRPSRFDAKVEFGTPDTVSREAMYKLFLNDKDVDYNKLASNTEGMTGSHIKETCVRGVLSKLRDDSLDLSTAILNGIRDLKKEDNWKMPPAPKGMYDR